MCQDPDIEKPHCEDEAVSKCLFLVCLMAELCWVNEDQRSWQRMLPSQKPLLESKQGGRDVEYILVDIAT